MLSMWFIRVFIAIKANSNLRLWFDMLWTSKTQFFHWVNFVLGTSALVLWILIWWTFYFADKLHNFHEQCLLKKLVRVSIHSRDLLFSLILAPSHELLRNIFLAVCLTIAIAQSRMSIVGWQCEPWCLRLVLCLSKTVHRYS